ncbi:MAG: hypothetical protein ABIG84_07715 [archaeon]
MGYICSLKSTVSRQLAPRLGIPRYETKDLGEIATEATKDERYRLFSKLAEDAILGHDAIILDGTFGKKDYRQAIYDMAKGAGVDEIFLIHCYCDDVEEIWRRITERAKNECPCVSEWLDKTHDDLCGDLYLGETPVVFEIDTNNYVLHSNPVTPYSLKINGELEGIVEQLKLYKPGTAINVPHNAGLSACDLPG